MIWLSCNFDTISDNFDVFVAVEWTVVFESSLFSDASQTDVSCTDASQIDPSLILILIESL